MIVNWSKYEKVDTRLSNQSSKKNHSNKSSKNNSRSYGKDFQYTNDPFLGDIFQEKNSSITSANSLHNNNYVEVKDKDRDRDKEVNGNMNANVNCYINLNEIDMSEINDYKANEDEDCFISHMESSINFFDLSNSHSQSQSQSQSTLTQTQSQTQMNATEALNKNFLHILSNKKAFNSLLNLIDQNPINFLQYYFPILISNFQDIIFNTTTNILFIKLFSYFTKYHKEVFYNKIIKSYFSLITHNQSSVEVLNQFIFTILNDALLVNIIDLIKVNIVDLATDENGSTVLLNLLNQRNAFISKIIYFAIVDNLMVIALSSNGVKVIIHLMMYSNCTQRLIEELLKNVYSLITHLNGHVLIAYILTFQSSHISSLIINCLCSNLVVFASDENGQRVIEQCLMYCSDCVVIFPLLNAFCSKDVVRKLCQNKIGLKVLMKVVDYSSMQIKTFLLNQIKAETVKIKE